jgi:prepilin-type N-terminal cleavage/methylation domain-containing protein
MALNPRTAPPTADHFGPGSSTAHLDYSSDNTVWYTYAGFSFLELLVVIAILGIVIAMALPSLSNSLTDYRLHSDASAVASLLNVSRMKAASQYAPYRLDISPSHGTFVLERLCGNTPSGGTGGDSNCTSGYNPFTTPSYDGSGTQYVALGDAFSSCLPAGPSVYPGTITADPSGCPGSPPDPLPIYFNTRGSPVDGTGSPLSNGGVAVYLKNQNNMVDAVTVSVGGRVTVWNWDVNANKWFTR